MFFFSNHLTLTKEIVILFIFFKNFRIKFPCLLEWTQLDVVLLGFTGFYWVLLGSTGFYWISPSFTLVSSFDEFQGVYGAVNSVFNWVFPGFYRVLLGLLYRVFRNAVPDTVRARITFYATSIATRRAFHVA